MSTMMMLVALVVLILTPFRVDANPVQAVVSAAEASKALTAAVQEVSKSLTRGSGNEAYVKWIGDLEYSINKVHGKVVHEGHDKHGGIITVTKDDSGSHGAKHKVTFKDPKTKQKLAEVYLQTFLDSSHAKVSFTYGEEHFLHKTVEKNGSAALIIIEVKKPKSLEKKPAEHGKTVEKGKPGKGKGTGGGKGMGKTMGKGIPGKRKPIGAGKVAGKTMGKGMPGKMKPMVARKVVGKTIGKGMPGKGKAVGGGSGMGKPTGNVKPGQGNSKKGGKGKGHGKGKGKGHGQHKHSKPNISKAKGTNAAKGAKAAKAAKGAKSAKKGLKGLKIGLQLLEAI